MKFWSILEREKFIFIGQQNFRMVRRASFLPPFATNRAIVMDVTGFFIPISAMLVVLVNELIIKH